MKSSDFFEAVNRAEGPTRAADAGGEHGRAEGPLVILTKSAAAPKSLSACLTSKKAEKKPRESRRESRREIIDEETGEVVFVAADSRRELRQVADDSSAVHESRNARFMLQRRAAAILAGDLTPRRSEWRVTGCAWRRVADDVRVMHSAELKKSHFANLMICGSVWTCPVCSAKISERRKQEIVQATDVHVGAGGGMYMVTFTFSHSRQDDLKALVKGLREALRSLREQRGYKRLLQYSGFVGLIRALEVTHREENGWHPHVHELWLTASRLSREALRILQRDVFDFWRDACIRAGLSAPNRKRGVTIIEAYSAEEYVTKFGRETSWGTGSELTKAHVKKHVKKGRSKGRTPFDLLRASADGCARSGSLFKDFARAFYGARQLFWSRGLKSAFGISEKTDEDLAVEEVAHAVEQVAISKGEWSAVLRQPWDVRGLILSLSENGGADSVRLFLAGLVPPGGGGVDGCAALGDCPF